MSQSHLFPITHFKTGFTTCASVSHPSLTSVPLTDDALGVHKAFSLPHELVAPPSSPDPSYPEAGTTPDGAPAPGTAWQARYPKGSINPRSDREGGSVFYIAGPPDFAKALEESREALISYRVLLDAEWEWVRGGKMPGMYGGEGDLAYHCSGGRQSERCRCFNLRLMWRAHGHGELYAYLPPSDTNKNRLSAVPPRSIVNPDYGVSAGRGAFIWPKARWVTLAERVRLNDVGQANGEVQVWVDGQSVINVNGLILRENADSRIKGIHFSTFFGGHEPEWASPKDLRAWFSDFSGAVIE
ncbi:polysaccharide lyase family 14 protein [Coniophora puteana RWD-64-598 SS2]|uniref:Polysaccharide lyase family 14 protein n=1 Tax=Coniophora puteana (strain RWD-64-598) TaxID=741705 RepID=A0A5M3MMF7_CONPW|nr:polysaccharide lyase family 14 protein [Coniophora puteana RWD-64-598 SS2]EIW80200.1 polysaccharide lyase family 14 protein [Coniophora puteana RWD-64-598 SS2]